MNNYDFNWQVLKKNEAQKVSDKRSKIFRINNTPKLRCSYLFPAQRMQRALASPIDNKFQENNLHMTNYCYLIDKTLRSSTYIQLNPTHWTNLNRTQTTESLTQRSARDSTENHNSSVMWTSNIVRSRWLIIARSIAKFEISSVDRKKKTTHKLSSADGAHIMYTHAHTRTARWYVALKIKKNAWMPGGVHGERARHALPLRRAVAPPRPQFSFYSQSHIPISTARSRSATGYISYFSRRKQLSPLRCGWLMLLLSCSGQLGRRP